WCPAGRWGPRRVRVTECWAVLTAEHMYTELIRDNLERLAPGQHGSATWKLDGYSADLGWEVRANSVWRFGRVFFRCPKCARLATRIYVPNANAWAACRRCWGLTYPSRQFGNYKNYGGGFLGAFGFTHRDFALSQTHDNRRRREAAAWERYAERRRIMKRQKRKARSFLPAKG